MARTAVTIRYLLGQQGLTVPVARAEATAIPDLIGANRLAGVGTSAAVAIAQVDLARRSG